MSIRYSKKKKKKEAAIEFWNSTPNSIAMESRNFAAGTCLGVVT
jgi:hypothetical protein